MDIKSIVIMSIVFIVFVAVGVADFTPRHDRSMEQIEKMRERLKEQNTHVIERREEVQKEEQQTETTREDIVQAEPIIVRL
jgi:C4-dicarboxylate-specific signal transduction histidine kinase